MGMVVLRAFAATAEGSEAAAPCLFVIGDSTAAAYPAERYPLTGWAQVLPRYFDPALLRVADRARSGRSSKSFIEEGAWAAVLAEVKAGDYVLIQFGHNDSKAQDPKRYTEPRGTYLDFLRQYIDDTRAKGATPLLATSINRNTWTEGVFQDSNGDYPPAMRELAKESGVPLIDLHQRTRELIEKLGPVEAAGLFMNLDAGVWPRYPEGKEDNTHLQEKGAHAVAKLFVEEVRRIELSFAHAVLGPAS
jgi:lysophospholipase L1-like esterase